MFGNANFKTVVGNFLYITMSVICTIVTIFLTLISANGTEVTTEPTVECNRHDLLGSVVEAASPYLYPCTIQYSLVATGKHLM